MLDGSEANYKLILAVTLKFAASMAVTIPPGNPTDPLITFTELEDWTFIFYTLITELANIFIDCLKHKYAVFN